MNKSLCRQLPVFYDKSGRDHSQEAKNFNNLIFNSSNGPGYMPGILSDVMHLSAR